MMIRTENQIMATAHSYARAYAHASFKLGDPSITSEDYLARVERARTAWDRVTQAIAASVDASPTAGTADAVEAGFLLLAYAEARREGEGADAAADLRELVARICA